MADNLQARNAWISTVLGYAMPSNASASDAAAFGKERAALEPRMTEAMRADPVQSSALSASWATIEQHEAAGELDRARAVAARLQEKVDRILASAAPTQAERFGIAPGLVAQRRAELEALLRRNIETASALTADAVGGFAAELDQVIEQPEVLVAAMEQYVAALFARIDKDLNAAAQQNDIRVLRQRVAAWQSTVAADAGLAAIRGAAGAFNLDDPGDTIGAMLDEVLADIESSAA